jgi:hypothetical protein
VQASANVMLSFVRPLRRHSTTLISEQIELATTVAVWASRLAAALLEGRPSLTAPALWPGLQQG